MLTHLCSWSWGWYVEENSKKQICYKENQAYYKHNEAAIMMWTIQIWFSAISKIKEVKWIRISADATRRRLCNHIWEKFDIHLSYNLTLVWRRCCVRFLKGVLFATPFFCKVENDDFHQICFTWKMNKTWKNKTI